MTVTIINTKMTPKFLPLLVVVAASAGLFALGCGGNGGGAPGSSSAPYVTRVARPASSGIASLMNAQLSAAAGGFAYGSYDSVVNSVQVNQAMSLNADTGEATNWNPPNFTYSTINGTDGSQQVGYGQSSDDLTLRGLIWSNSPDNPIEVLPAGIVQVVLYAVDAGFQVGVATPSGSLENHPYLFQGNGGAVDLIAGGFTFGEAHCISGNNIGGLVEPNSGELPQAAYWSSHSASSFVNLQPAGYLSSAVLGISADQQGGWGLTSVTDANNDQVMHALIWTGSAASVVDINPSDTQGSVIYAVRNGKQAGFYSDNSAPEIHKACVWSSTAASMVDIDHLIPASHTYSTAYAIDEQGRVYGSYIHNGQFWTAVWTPN
jgi:hypothetical protein